MSSFSEEIQQLHQRIIELEKQEKEKDENYKKQSIEYNLTVVYNLLAEKKRSITNNKYSKSVPLARYYDVELVTHLEATYNICKILETRLNDLQKKESSKCEK